MFSSNSLLDDTDTVVLIDDASTDLMLLETYVKRLGKKIITISFAKPKEALEWLATNHADLVITDYRMPDMNGIEFVQAYRLLPGGAEAQVIMVTSVEEEEVFNQALKCSVADFFYKPLDEPSVKARVVNLLTLRRQAELLRSRAKPIERQINLIVEGVQSRERSLLRAFAAVGKFHDGYRARTLNRLSSFAAVIASQLPLTYELRADLELAVPLCDVGNILVPAATINHTSKLSNVQWTAVRMHPQMGADIIQANQNHGLGYLNLAAEIALLHHENFDGSGYPLGRAGQDIPVGARICAVADSLDAMLTHRPYRPAMTLGDALQEIQALSGKRFCPMCVEALVSSNDRIAAIVAESTGSV